MHLAAPRRRLTVVVAVLLASGCAGPRSSEIVEVAPDAIPRRPPEVRPGLVVERLRVRDAAPMLDAALIAIPEVGASPTSSERWRREGLLVKIVDEDGLAALEATLGAAVLPSRTWHGEATGWRSAARRRLARGSVILQDGRARRVEEAILSLAVRGWSIPLVDGAAVQIEIVPQLIGTMIDPLAAPVPPGELRGVALAPLIERTLAPNEVLLIATVPDRRRSDTSSDELDGDSHADQDAPEAPTAPRPFGPGPVANLPPTLGGWLVDDPVSGDRGVLLLRGRPHPAVGLPGTSNPEPGVVIASP